MKKVLNKSMALLIVMSMVLGMFGGMSVFAAASNSAYAKADFDNASSAEGVYDGMTFAHVSKAKNGFLSLETSKIPYYGKMLKYEQESGSENQVMTFILDTPIPMGETTEENRYMEFSYDIKLEKSSTGVYVGFGENTYRLNFDAKGNFVPVVDGVYGPDSVGTAPSGSNGVFNNIRVKVDLYNRKIVAIYADDTLITASPISCASDTFEAIEKLIIYIAKPKEVDTLYLDNVNVVTYKSTDGTSPVANKSALRSKLNEFTGISLNGSAKVTFDNAVELAKNPLATQTDVDNAVASLSGISTTGWPDVVVSEGFDSGLGTVYDDFTITYNSYSKQGTPKVITDASPIYGNWYAFAQKEGLDKAGAVNFVLNNPVDYSENANKKYVEFTFDLKTDLRGTTQQVRLLEGSTVASHMNVGEKEIRIGTAYADAIVCTYANNGLADGYDKNVKVILDLKNKVVKALYVNDVKLKADGTGEYLTNIPMGTATTINTIEYRWGSNKHGAGDNGYTFAVDNVELVTYTSNDGTSPIGLKKALRDKIGQVYEYAFSSADQVKYNNALAVAKNPVATAEEVTNALASLNTVKLTNAKVFASKDFETGADGVYADFDYKTTYNKSAAATETIFTANDANPILNKMFGLMHGAQSGDKSTIKNMYPVANFTLKNTPTFEGAKEGDFAEVAFDVKVRAAGSTTFAAVVRDENSQEIARIHIGKDIARVGYGYTDEDARVGLYDTIGLEDSFDKNVKLVFDLYNKDLEAVYINGIRLLDRTEAHNQIANIALNPNAGTKISKLAFNWSDGSDTTTTTGYTFALDNLRIMTYSGETPEANKAAFPI